MKTRYLHPALQAMLSLALLMFATVAVAQGEKSKAADEAKPGTVATLWLVWTKAGQEQQFEAALKQHAAWRKGAGEGFTWSIYQPVVGNNMDHYVIRSGEHHWKDMDANEVWSIKAKANENFNQNVGPFVQRFEHYFSETDADNSHWIESQDYKYFAVTQYATKPGTYGARSAAIAKVTKAVKAANWPYPYEISSTIGGDGGMSIVTPMKSYAEMEEPDPSLMKILAKSLGSEAAAAETMQQFGSTINATNHTIYLYRPDLSTPR